MKRQMTALLLAAVMLLAGGCSPQGDISKRSIVTAAAVVLTGEGEYQLSVEYLTQLSSEEQSWEYRTGSGSSFAQAVTAIELASGKSLYLDGCKVLVVEGTDSRRQLQGLLEEIDAHGGIRPLTLVAVTPKTGELLESQEGRSAGEEVFRLLTGSALSELNLKDCLNLMRTPGRGLLLPVVERREGEARVAGYLSPGARSMLTVPAMAAHLLPFAEGWGGEDRVYSVAGEGFSADWVLERAHRKIRPRVVDGEVSFLIEASVQGYLLSARGELSREELLERAQEEICRQLLKEYGYVQEKIAAASGNDLFSLGKHLELSGGGDWQRLGRDWGERLPEVGVELRGTVLLRDKKRLYGRG